MRRAARCFQLLPRFVHNGRPSVNILMRPLVEPTQTSINYLQHKKLFAVNTCFLHFSACRHCNNHEKGDNAAPENDDARQRASRLEHLPDYVRDHVFLSDMPFHFLPNFWKSIRNRIFEFMIKGYFDHDFSIATFISGATHAVIMVSNALADGDIGKLESMDVISPDALAEVKDNLAKMSLVQRSFLRLSPEDILRSFIYEIGIILDDETDEKYVEILFVVHGQHGFGDLRNKLKLSAESSENLAKTNTLFANAVQPFGSDEFVGNYRFIRQFRSPSIDSTNASYWLINKLNHFRPIHYVLRHQFEQGQ